MEISRQRIGQSIYETFYNKCNCCSGSGFKKTNLFIHNIISNIKGADAIGRKDDVEIKIDENFYTENYKDIDKRIKALKLSLKINFVLKTIPKEIFGV